MSKGSKGNEKEYVECIYHRGDVYDEMKKFDKALIDYNQAIEIDGKKNSEWISNRGFVYYELGKFEEAIENFNQAIEIDEKFGSCYNNRGFAYKKLGMFQKAIDDFNTVIGFFPNHEKYYNYRGVTFNDINEFDKALKDFNKAIELNNKYAECYYNRGKCYLKMEKYDKAIQDFHRAVGEGHDLSIKEVEKLQSLLFKLLIRLKSEKYYESFRMEKITDSSQFSMFLKEKNKKRLKSIITDEKDRNVFIKELTNYVECEKEYGKESNLNNVI